MEGIPGAKKERLQTIEVPNSVVWVNENLRAPFDIRLGEQSKLGVLLALGGEEGDGFPGIPREYHRRSLDIGKVYFEDTEHRIYRDVDMKGTGLLAGDTQDKDVLKPTRWFFQETPPDMRGLLDTSEAIHDAEIAELFTKLGMRTHRAIAVIALKELNAAPKKQLPVEVFKIVGELADEFDPAVEVRAFGTKTRIGDILPVAHPLMTGAEFLAGLRNYDPDKLDALGIQPQLRRLEPHIKSEIQDALGVLEKEFGRPFTVAEYVPWLIGEIGRNIGIMHNAGYIHRFLHSQNITLDGRLTDFDTTFPAADLVEHPEELSPQEIQEDQEALFYDELNYAAKESRGQTKAVLDWLEPSMVMLQKVYSEELMDFDATQTDQLFFKSYWEQLTNENIRAIARMFLEGNNLPVPGETK